MVHDESFIMVFWWKPFKLQMILIWLSIESHIFYKTGIVHGAKEILWFGPPLYVSGRQCSHQNTFFFFEITSLPSPTSHSWRPSHLQEEELRSSVSEYGNTSICSALWKAFFCKDLMAQQKCVSRVWKFTSKGWTKFEMHGFPKRSGAFESVEDEQWSTNTALPILQPLQLLPERWNTWTIAWTAGRMFFSLLCALHIHRLAGLPRDWGRWDHGIIGSFQANWKLHLKEHTYCMCICWNSKIHTAQQSFRSQEHPSDHRNQANHTWDHTSHIWLYTYVNIYTHIIITHMYTRYISHTHTQQNTWTSSCSNISTSASSHVWSLKALRFGSMALGVHSHNHDGQRGGRLSPVMADIYIYQYEFNYRLMLNVWNLKS